MVAYILCCCSCMIFNSYFERFIRQTMLMNTFKIESPIIATAFLYTVFLYFWLWSKFFSSSVSSQISLLRFSFICFGFISLLGWWSCERIHEFPSWEAWSILLFDISVLVQPSVVFIVFVDIVSLSIVFFFWNFCIRCICVQTTISVLSVWQYSYYSWFHFIFFSEVRNFLLQ